MMQTRGLTLMVGDRTLVANLDWQVNAGECWCVIGRNGAGKSTLLRTLVGLRDADRGQVLINDTALSQWPLQRLAQQRSYLAQGRNDAFAYRALETVLSARHPYHDASYWESADDHAQAYAALKTMDAQDLAERDVRTLSGGERQRVAMAAVLAQDAPLMLLDEPTSALDLAHQVAVMRLLSSLCREKNKSVIMVSHDLNLAHGVATHALLLMGDGTWHAGAVQDVMQPDLLSSCLGHPIDIIKHNGRTIYVAAEESL